MNRLSIWIVLSTTLLMLVACQPVLMLPSDASFSSEEAVAAEAEDVATENVAIEVNSIAFDGEVYSVGQEVWGIASADLNDDDLPDLVVVDAASGGIGVFLNPGDGSFESGETYATGEAPNSVTPIDVDGDGDLDLAVANAASANVSVLTNDGSGLFEVSAEYGAAPNPWWVYAADLNNDGFSDLGMAHETEMAGILINDGDGAFEAIEQYVVGEYGGNGSIRAADVNGDGFPDLVARHSPTSLISVMMNQGDGSFDAPVDYEIEGEPHGANTADLNADGALDIIAPTGGGEEPGRLHVLLNGGSGTFLPSTTYSTGAFPLEVAPVDLDGDDDLDLLVTNCGSETVGVFKNDGTGQLQHTAALAMPVCPAGIVVGDFDGAGGPEMVVSSFDGSVMVMTLPEGLVHGAEAGVLQPATTVTETVAPAESIAEAELAPRLKPARILFIGNSFVSRHLGIGAHLAGIVNAADPDTTIETDYLAGDGTTLVTHSQLDAPAKIREGDWDAVVLEEEVLRWTSPEEFSAGVRALDQIIDEIDATTVILVPWAPTDDPALSEEMVEVCEQIGAEVDATLVPVGQAWQRVRGRDADIALLEHTEFINDLAVPGTYLTALVFYQSLYGGEPDFVPYLPVDALPNPENPSYSLEKMREKWAQTMSEEDAALLQQVAWETVMDYEMGQRE